MKCRTVEFFIVSLAAGLLGMGGCSSASNQVEPESSSVVAEATEQSRQRVSPSELEQNEATEEVTGESPSASKPTGIGQQTDSALASEPASKEASKAADSRTDRPLTVTEYVRVFDSVRFLGDLQLEDKISESFGREATTMTSQPPEDLVQTCQQLLQAEDWKLIDEQVMQLAGESSRIAMQFQKQDQHLALTVSGPSQGQTMLMVKLLGNIDMRTLPAPPSSELIKNSDFSYAGYVLDETIENATLHCREMMDNQGWQEFDCIGRPSCLPNANGKNQVIGFAQAGFAWYASIGQYPNYQAGRTVVTYASVGILPLDLTITEDAQDLELDVLVGRARYTSALPPKEIRALVAADFDSRDNPLIDSSGNDALIDTYKTGEQEQVLVDMTPRENGSTSVQLIRQFEADSTK